MNHYKKKRSDTLKTKLERLILQSTWNTAALPDCVKNLSSHTLTPDERSLLGLGLSFALPPRPETYTDLITSIMQLESYARELVPELRTLKGCVLSALQDLDKKLGVGLPRRFHIALQSLRRNSSIIILKADKGNMVTIMDKGDYRNAAYDMLSDSNIYQQLRKNPTESEQAAYNKEIGRIYESMPIGCVPHCFNAYLPTLAHLYLNPKLHKDPISYRPIVSQAQAFTTPLAKHLSKILTPCLGSFSPAHLHDSVHLKNIILDKADPSIPFGSIDIDSLFTNVPIEPLLEFLHTKHTEGNLPIPDNYTIEGLLDLILLCVNATVFPLTVNFTAKNRV